MKRTQVWCYCCLDAAIKTVMPTALYKQLYELGIKQLLLLGLFQQRFTFCKQPHIILTFEKLTSSGRNGYIILHYNDVVTLLTWKNSALLEFVLKMCQLNTGKSSYIIMRKRKLLKYSNEWYLNRYFERLC